jgi:hypothetical protein
MKRDTILTIDLPTTEGKLAAYPVREPRQFEKPTKPFTRKALAAAHVVADPLSTKDPWLETAIDWDATLAYRRHLWSWGFGVAEAMDTAQRGMGLDWSSSLMLIEKSIKEARTIAGAEVWSGAGTDHVANTNPTASPPTRSKADREARWAHHPYGEPRARRLREIAGRLRQGLRPDPVAGEAAGDYPLAGRDVRSGS